MKKYLLLCCIAWSAHLSAHNRLVFLKEGQSHQVCIVKQDTDTICGTTDLSMIFESGRLTLTDTRNEKTTVFNANIKYILLDKIRLQTLIMEDDAFYSEYYLIETDTIGKVKLYEGYTTVVKEYGNAAYLGGSINSSKEIYYSYILKMGKKQLYVINEFNSVTGFDAESKCKKQLKKIFGQFPQVVKYIDTLEQLKFDEIPKVVKHINSIL